MATASILAACPGGADDGSSGVGPPILPGTTTAAGSGESTSRSSSTADATSADGTATSSDPIFDVGMGNTTGSSCVPVSDMEMVCDGLDDDCNGVVDEVDEGQDGICDCLAIAIIGTPGSLASSEFEQWLIDRGTTTERINPPVVDAMGLGAYDVVILDQLTRSYDPAEAMAFEAWVTAGGGLMSMTGHTANPVSAQQWPNSILSTFGLEYQGRLLSGPVTDFLPHPISMGLSSVTFLGGFAVVETIPGSSDVVGQLAGPVPVAQAQVHGAGKVFVWGDEWIEYDSEWTSMPEIALLWANIFSWLSPADVCALPEG